MDRISILKQNCSSSYTICLENKEFENKKYNEHISVHNLHEAFIGKNFNENFNENFYLDNEFIDPSFIFYYLEKLISNKDFLVLDSPRYFIDDAGKLSDEGSNGILEAFKNTRNLYTIQLRFNLPYRIENCSSKVVYDKYIEEIDKWIKNNHISKTLIYDMIFFKASKVTEPNGLIDNFFVQIKTKHLN